ncbi:MAG TPA: O-antigen ligase family protein [Aliidongia sp.]|nr:O-antigen ligase family protein [Aliidongia sp.]
MTVPSQGERLLTGFALLLSTLIGPLAYATPLAMAALLPILALTMAAIAQSQGVLDLRPMLRAGLVWLPLLAFLPLSALWSLDARASLILSLRLVGLFASGVLFIHSLSQLPRATALPFIRGLAWGFMIAAVIVFTEAFDQQALAHLFNRRDGSSNLMSHYSRGGDFAAFLIPALAFGLWRLGQPRLAVAQLVIGGAAIMAGWEMSSKLALIVALIVAGLVLALPSLRWVLVAALALAALAIPFLVPIELTPGQTCWLAAHKSSGLHRVIIWNFVSGKIHERPWLGYGLDSARRMPGGTEHVTIHRCGEPDGPVVVDGDVLPLHPHNAVLQIWLELGAVGAILAFGALLASLSRSFLDPALAAPIPRAMIAALVAGAFGPGSLSFGIWQEWWIGTLFIGTAATVALGRMAAEPKDQRRSRENVIEHAPGAATL